MIAFILWWDISILSGPSNMTSPHPHAGSLNGFISMKMMCEYVNHILCSLQILTQMNTYRRCWTDVLRWCSPSPNGGFSQTEYIKTTVQKHGGKQLYLLLNMDGLFKITRVTIIWMRSLPLSLPSFNLWMGTEPTKLLLVLLRTDSEMLISSLWPF